MELVGKCLQDAKIESSDINDIVFVGGLIRIPKVQQMLQDFQWQDFEGKKDKFVTLVYYDRDHFGCYFFVA